MSSDTGRNHSKKTVAPGAMPLFRPVREADVEQLLALQNMSFNSRRTMADWNWRSVDNPYYQMATWVGAVGDRIVAGYSVVGMYLNVLGRPVLIGQSADAVVHPDYRGTGAFQELFDGTMQLGFQFGGKVVYGFPNEHSLRPILLNSPTEFILFNMNTYSLRLRMSNRSSDDFSPIGKEGSHGILPDSSRSADEAAREAKEGMRPQAQARRVNPILKAVFRGFRVAENVVRLKCNRALEALTIERTEELPAGYEEFWEQVKQKEILCIWKDTMYMRWRYDDNPHRRAVYFTARKGDKIVGLINYTERDSINYITEILVPDRDVSLGKLLVGTVVRESLEQDIEVVKFYGHDRGFMELVFSDFTRHPAEDLSFQAQFSDKALEELCTQSLNWSATTGDTDVIWV